MLSQNSLPLTCSSLNAKASPLKPVSTIVARSVSLPSVPLPEQKTVTPGLHTRSRRRSSKSRSRSPSPQPQREASPLAPPKEVSLNVDALSQEGELLCCQLIQEADKPGASPSLHQAASRAQEKLLEAHRPYLAREARRFQSNVYGGKRAPYDDMLLAGITGLIQAAKRFNPPELQRQQQQQQQTQQPRAARFLSYAHSYIQKSMREACNGVNEVYIPRYLMDMRQRVMQALGEMEAEAQAAAAHSPDSRPPQIGMRAVAARAGVTPKAVRDLIHMTNLSYVGSGAGTDDDESHDFADMAYNLRAGNFLTNEGDEEHDSSLAVYSGTEALADQEVKGDALQGVLAQVLNKSEFEVLWRTMGLEGNGGDEAKQSKRQVAEEMGISHQRVSQIYFKALEKLQKACSTDSGLACRLTELCTLPG
ncbi:hypothetical protein DUNSADRAFT_9597 [Dunaliella salina]|uniref:RNA polymerase sigma-70 region 4 domain-containing protein n=1 Tax=Dunaliella salina TaxID=3046 RepID=A0ABQ7H5A2_DUNSA|nr:hypothetical protein DUNSADRAFT_9597 [Dunaliella salina]|eukprot:KAF5842028.1 hypothetical protein DUNSADRAFT_9597 [Dunaliella salina]